jgi:hypothetical protein
VNVGELSGLVASMAGAASVILSAAALIVRRMSKERTDLRDAQTLSVAQARFLFKIELLAARRGWDTDPQWPARPRELTPEYLEGKAEADGNPELTKFIELLGHSTGHGEKK